MGLSTRMFSSSNSIIAGLDGFASYKSKTFPWSDANYNNNRSSSFFHRRNVSLIHLCIRNFFWLYQFKFLIRALRFWRHPSKDLIRNKIHVLWWTAKRFRFSLQFSTHYLAVFRDWVRASDVHYPDYRKVEYC